MANIDLGWEVVGQMTREESVKSCLEVIESKQLQDSGTFWTWENKVCSSHQSPVFFLDIFHFPAHMYDGTSRS